MAAADAQSAWEFDFAMTAGARVMRRPVWGGMPFKTGGPVSCGERNGGTKMGSDSKLTILAEKRAQQNRNTPAYKRLEKLFDAGSFTEMDAFAKADDTATGVVAGYGAIEGSTVFAFSQDSTVDGGAVGKAHAAKIRKVYELAAKTGAPVVGMFDSNGARVAEGNDVLAAYGEMLLISNNLSGVVPQVALVLGVCAGSAAMVAASADFVVMKKDAQLFLTAPFITGAQGDSTEGAGSADNAAKSGVAHILADSEDEAIAKARELTARLPLNNLSAAPVASFSEADAADFLRVACENLDAADTDGIVDAVLDAESALELQKEFGKSVYAGLATVAGASCGFVATRRSVNGGRIDAAACAKIARLVRLCDAFALPVVTFVDTQGFVPSAADELAGSVREAAKLAHAYAEATCPKVAVVTGNAIGPAYIAMAGRNANADVTVAWPSAVISAMEPVAAATFLWDERLAGSKDLAADREKLVQQYIETAASPYEAANGGHIDDVIDPADTRAALIAALDMLAGKRVSNLPKKHGNMPL